MSGVLNKQKLLHPKRTAIDLQKYINNDLINDKKSDNKAKSDRQSSINEDNKNVCQPPNQHIFKNYGSLDDANSKLSRSQFLLITHGVSTYNTFAEKFRKKLEKEIPGDPELDKEVKKRRKLEEVQELGNWRKNLHIVDGKLEKVGYQ